VNCNGGLDIGLPPVLRVPTKSLAVHLADAIYKKPLPVVRIMGSISRFRDDGPFQRQQLQQFRDGRDLVRLLLNGHLPQRQSRVRGPRADQVQRPQALRLARRAAGGLAADGDDKPLQGLLQRGGPADQTGRELPRGDQTQHATERVVCRKAVRQLEELLKPHAPTDRKGRSPRRRSRRPRTTPPKR